MSTKVKDIFNDEGLQLCWNEMEALEREFYSLSLRRQEDLLEKHPKLRGLVTCQACGQRIPHGPVVEDLGKL